MSNYTCTCVNDKPKCKPKSSVGGGGGGVKFNTEKYIRMQLMQGIIEGMFNSLLAPPDNTANEKKEMEANMARIAEENKRIAEENKRKAALAAWKEMQAEEARKAKLDRDAKANQGKKLMLKMQTVGGKIEPFSAGNPRVDLKPMSQNTYPSTGFTMMQRLMCSAYFAGLARKSADDDDARFYTDQSQRVMTGEPTYLECRIPAVTSDAAAKRMDKLKKTYEDMSSINIKIDEIDKKLTEKDGEITKDEKTRVDIETEISNLQNRATSAPPEEKEGEGGIDDLLRQAREQKQELDTQIQNKQKARDVLQTEKEQAADEFKTLNASLGE